MTNRGKKRALSLALSLALLLGLLPAAALADETGGPAPLELENAGEQTTLDISKGNIKITADSVFGKDADGNEVNTHDPDGYVITQADAGTPTANKISVTGGTHAITLDGVNIDVSVTGDACAFDMTGANVALTLADSSNNSLKSGSNRAGLEVPEGAMLTIEGGGKLAAAGGNFGAGIGGGGDGGGGTITIGGSAQVMARGGRTGAGIGGGFKGGGGTVTIGGSAQVTASGSSDGSGIGGGSGGGGGTVIIKDSARVMAAGGAAGSGIGSGFGGSGGDITVEGSAQVETAGGSSPGSAGAGIGCSSGGTVTIKDSAWVEATGGTSNGGGGAGIGGYGGDSVGGGGSITIEGGAQVTAKGGDRGAGIGGGGGRYRSGGSGGIIAIRGRARVTAAGGSSSGTGGAGIGGGGGTGGGDGGNVTVEGDVVIFATGGEGAAHVGAGKGGSGGSKALSGGVVFEGIAGKVYGNVTLSGDLTVPAGDTLTIPDSSTLTIPENVTLTNQGTIHNNGTITNNGTLDNHSGTITGSGQYQGNGTVVKAPRTITLPGASQVDVTSVTLQPAVPSAGAGDGTVEYTKSGSNSAPTDDGAWQSGSEFSGLAENTPYYFFARITGGTYYADAVSGGVPATTGRAVYAVTVNGGTASPASASEGASVTITATVPSGQQFQAWTGLDGLTITEGSAFTEEVTFTMPARAVVATASFEAISTGGGPSYYSRTLTDKTTGVKVEGRSIHESARLAVKAEGLHSVGDAGCDLLRTAQTGGHLLGAWDLSLSRGFRGNITVSLPVEGRDGQTLTVAHCIDGKLTLSDVKVSGDFAKVETDSLSPFAVLDGVYTLAELGWENPFTDVDEGDWFYDAVAYVHQKDLMVGTTDTAFGPDGPVTRAQVWTVLARLDGASTSGGAPWYAPARDWAVKTSVSDGTDPDGPVTREQLVTMLYRYAQNAGMDVSVGGDTNILSYDDAFTVAEWAIPAFQWACGAGVVSGTSDTTLSPQAGATRAQLAAVLTRMTEK